MNVYKAVPNIRFNGFEDKWKINRLLTITTVYSGLTYKPEDIQTSGTLVLRSSNIQEGKIIKKDCVYVNSSVVNSINVEKKDVILVVRNGSKKLIGKHAIVMQNMKKTVIGAFMSGLRPKNGDFLNALLNTETFKKEVFRSLGATINQITNKDLKRMKFYLPFSYEQQKIGNFFAKLDKLLDLQQQKIDKLELLKKTLLQKLFPRHDARIPEFRFKGFEDDWKKTRIGKIVQYSNSTYSVKDLKQKKEKKFYSVYDATGRQYYSNSFDMDKKYIAIIKDGSNVGAVKLLPARTSVLSTMGYLGAHNSDIAFDYYVFKKLNFKKYKVGSGIPHIYFSDYKKQVELVPQLSEQQKIGNLLSKVDQLIELENKKLQNFQQVKKCLLQNMFVE
ncbi:restriction endonuclease subunit S [Lactobacillus helsingborgensis]|uniref:restriction endonuclease subunit S n=1 Tax=Lactobacillus helsingborgensis TaxID=1218494 RepID=UPI0022645517|nr:restriction endonuclease subunit S [Lactobacillus helsingborgensis]UZX32008.1 restriction endonuclease subunit S [Lactobacillus helsingborgensis]